jgi:cytochrome P450
MTASRTLSVPGPKTPAAWQLLRYAYEPLPFIEQCGRRYGETFVLRLARFGPCVLLSAPEAVRDVFRGDGHSLHSGEGNNFLIPAVGPNSVVVLDEEPHARQRRVLVPPLKGERMRSFFEAMQAATVEELRRWPVGRPVRMLEPMQGITLRVILRAILGLTAGAERDEIEGGFQHMLSAGRSRYGIVLARITPLVWLLQKTRASPFFRRMHVLNQSLYTLIESRRRLPAADRGDNLLADLLATAHDDGRPTGDQEIRDALVTLLAGGHDTTAISLAWALEQVVGRPDVMACISDELRRVTGGGPPRAEHLPRLEYLDAVIRETLRVRTIIPFVVRLTKQPFVAGGREYPEGVMLCPCSHLVHRRPDLYPEPDKFRPERFLERKYAAHEWFPFGGGNRTCLGTAFALYEMKVVFATLFSQARLTRPEGSCSRPVRRGVSLAPHDGVEMIVG